MKAIHTIWVIITVYRFWQYPLYGLFPMVVLASQSVASSPTLSTQEDNALYKILDLKTEEAEDIISRGTQYSGDQLYWKYLDNWKSVMSLVGHENAEGYQKYKQSFKSTIKEVDALDNNAPSFLVKKAEMYAHAGMINIMYGDYLSGFRKVLTAKSYMVRNGKQHPDYWEHDKLDGVLNVALDNVPSVLKWLTSLVGLSGDQKQGFQQLNKYTAKVRHQPGLLAEATVYQVFVLKLVKNDQQALATIYEQYGMEDPPAIVNYLKANLLYHTQQNEAALALLDSFQEDFSDVPFYHVDYLKGKAKLNRLDPDADQYMLRFMQQSKLRNFQREMHSKLAYHYVIKDEPEKYHFHMDEISSQVKPTSDRDREATIESKRSYMPHVQLLKARLLIDGGYFSRARVVLDDLDVRTLNMQVYQTEYLLLEAKVLSGLDQKEKAAEYFQQAIAKGSQLDEHYALEATFLAGQIAQETGDFTSAKDYWNAVINQFNSKDIYSDNIQKKAQNLIQTI